MAKLEKTTEEESTKELAKKVEKKATKKPVVKKTKKSAAEKTAEPKTEKLMATTKSKQEESTAKAGKRSKKSLDETAAKEAKEIKKASKSDESEAPKQVQKPRIIKYSKNQTAARALVEPGKLYSVSDALALLPKLSSVKFDPTAEVHIRANLDTKQADQSIRTHALLPAGSGKTVRVAVLASDKDATAAKAAGADITTADALLSDIAKSKFDFDVLIATPERMSELGRHAKVLGPKGLMPSPKDQTVTNKPAEQVEAIKKGRAEIKNDAAGIMHVAFGKLSFSTKDLENNLYSILSAVKSNKPAGVKGTYIQSIYLTSSMSPSIALDTTEALKGPQK